MDFNITVIPGDGIGPEIVAEGVKVLNAVGKRFNHSFNFTEVPMGGCAYDQYGTPLPDHTLETALKSDSVLLGAVGGEKWDTLPGHLRPEKALLQIRSALKLYANLRPAIFYPALIDGCPLKAEIVAGGFNILTVRELTGGIYFGERGRYEDGQTAYDTEQYSVEEVERIGLVAFKAAQNRKKKLCSIDKANVLESSRLWREVMQKLAKDFPDVEYSNMLVDNAAMQLIRDPKQFDVIVANNMFGDILSDETSMLTGSIGMLPSASLGASKLGMYEPIHGSAPDIAGKGIANPIATILSCAMMLNHSFNLLDEAQVIEDAVNKVLNQNIRTKDIMSEGMKLVSTSEMGNAICENILV